MNFVYLIGNGFDLNLGLKTSYKDFYNHYINASSKSNVIGAFKNDIHENLTKWSDLELRYGEYTDELKSYGDLDEIHTSIVDELAEYLRKIQENFVTTTLAKINSEDFKQCLFHPENYLRGRDAAAIKSFYSDKGGKVRQFNVVTFNYTHTIEYILGVDTASNRNDRMGIQSKGSQHIYNLNSIQHVHGSIDSDMVLGVDNNYQIKNDELSGDDDAIDLIVKPACNEAMRHAIEVESQTLLNAADVICIFGSSIGETDQTWWDLIAHQLKKRDCKLIIFEYNPNYNKRHSQKQNRLKKEIIKKFLNVEDIDDLSEKVHFGFNSKMFCLQDE